MKYYNGAIFFFFLLHTLTVICRGTEQFDYYDNDLARVCRPIERQLDVLFILDGSGSVSGSTFDTQIDMLNRIIQMVEIGPNRTQIAVMQYASFTRLEFAFAVNKDKDQLLKSVAGVHHMSGTTKTGKALDKALHLFADKSSGARMHPDVAQVMWRKNDREINLNDKQKYIWKVKRDAGVLVHEIVIRSATDADDGEYACIKGRQKATQIVHVNLKAEAQVAASAQLCISSLLMWCTLFVASIV